MTNDQIQEYNKQKEYFNHVKVYKGSKKLNQLGVIAEELEEYFNINPDGNNKDVPHEVLDLYSQILNAANS